MELTKSDWKRNVKPDPEEPAMVLTHEDLDRMGRALRKNFSGNKDSFIEAVISMTTIDLEGVEVALEPRLLHRLKTRCLKGSHWPTWLSQTVIKQLHDYAGY